VSSILAFRWEAFPTLRYFPNNTELALSMTLLELHYRDDPTSFLCPSTRWGRGDPGELAT